MKLRYDNLYSNYHSNIFYRETNKQPTELLTLFFMPVTMALNAIIVTATAIQRQPNRCTSVGWPFAMMKIPKAR